MGKRVVGEINEPFNFTIVIVIKLNIITITIFVQIGQY